MWVKERTMFLSCKIGKGYVHISELYDPKTVGEKSQKNIILSYKEKLILLIRMITLSRWYQNTVPLENREGNNDENTVNLSGKYCDAYDPC
jgi:hypothetical protein